MSVREMTARASKHTGKTWPRDRHDFYVEPVWVAERLLQSEPFDGMIWDPACGSGRIVLAARAAGFEAAGSDIVRRDRRFDRQDFLTTRRARANIVSNPPFGIADKFVPHALKLAERKVCMLLPVNWVQGDRRARWLATTPLRRVWFIAPRPSMPPGNGLRPGQKPNGGTTDFCWMVWLRGYDGAPEIRWLHRDGKSDAAAA
jgi:hypothetical protein